MEEDIAERKAFLAELNEISRYTATLLHGEDVSKVRIRQVKKYFNRTYNMLNRIAAIQGEITDKSFRYGYGGKILVRKVMLELGMIAKEKNASQKTRYVLLVSADEITLDLVSRIIVEVYLSRNDIQIQ